MKRLLCTTALIATIITSGSTSSAFAADSDFAKELQTMKAQIKAQQQLIEKLEARLGSQIEKQQKEIAKLKSAPASGIQGDVKISMRPSPKIESTGSGGGLKLFCKGVGANTPDITNASRRIKKSEYDDCQNNGVTEIVEVLVGYDGIAIANSTKSPQLQLGLKDVYLALAKDIPGPDGKLMPNPNKSWKDVNPSLPATKIEVLGPPPTSGTRDALVWWVRGGLPGAADDADATPPDEDDDYEEMGPPGPLLGARY